jgi:hypothetical protein
LIWINVKVRFGLVSWSLGEPQEGIPMPYRAIAATTILGMARVTQ